MAFVRPTSSTTLGTTLPVAPLGSTVPGVSIAPPMPVPSLSAPTMVQTELAPKVIKERIEDKRPMPLAPIMIEKLEAPQLPKTTVEFITIPNGPQLPLFPEFHVRSMTLANQREHAQLLHRTFVNKGIGAPPVADHELVAYILHVQRMHCEPMRLVQQVSPTALTTATMGTTNLVSPRKALSPAQSFMQASTMSISRSHSLAAPAAAPLRPTSPVPQTSQTSLSLAAPAAAPLRPTSPVPQTSQASPRMLQAPTVTASRPLSPGPSRRAASTAASTSLRSTSPPPQVSAPLLQAWPQPGSSVQVPQVSSMRMGTVAPPQITASQVIPPAFLSQIDRVLMEMERELTQTEDISTSRVDNDTSVDWFDKKILDLEAHREGSGRRQARLAELRRIIAEGRSWRDQQSMSTLMTEENDLVRVGSSRLSMLEADHMLLKRQVTDLEFDREYEERDGFSGQELERLAASLENEKIRAGALQDRLYQMESAYEREHRLAEELAEARNSSERDLRTLEESAKAVLQDCRVLQTKVREMEANSNDDDINQHKVYITELEKRLVETEANHNEQHGEHLKRIEILEVDLGDARGESEKHQNWIGELEDKHRASSGIHMVRIQELTTELNAAEGRHNALHDTVSHHVNRIGELEALLKAAEGHRANSHETASEHMERIRELEALLQAAEGHRANYHETASQHTERIRELEALLQAAEGRRASTHETASQHMERVRELESLLQAAEGRRANSHETASQHMERVRELESLLQVAEERHATSHETATQHARRIKELEALLQDAEQKHTDIHSTYQIRISEMEKSSGDSTRAAEELRFRIRCLEQEHGSAKEDLLSELTAQNTRHASERDDLHFRFATIQADKDSLEKELTQRLEERERAMAEFHGTKAESEKGKIMIQRLEEERDWALRDLKNARADKEMLETQHRQNLEERERAVKDLYGTRAEKDKLLIQRLEEERDWALKDHRSAKAEKELIEKQALERVEAERERALKELNRVKAQLQNESDLKAQLQTERGQLQSALDRAKAETSEVQLDMVSIKAERESAKRALADTQEERDRKALVFSEVKAEMELTKAESATLKAKVSELQLEIVSFKAERDSAKRALADTEEERDRKANNFSQLKAELESARSEISKLRADKESTLGEVQQARRTIRDLEESTSGELQQTRRNLRELEQDLATAQTSKQEFQNMLNDERSRANQLREELSDKTQYANDLESDARQAMMMQDEKMRQEQEKRHAVEEKLKEANEQLRSMSMSSTRGGITHSPRTRSSTTTTVVNTTARQSLFGETVRRTIVRELLPGNHDPFVVKVRDATRIASEAIDESTKTHLMAVEHQLTAMKEARSAGRNHVNAVQDYTQRALVESEQRTAASNVDAAMHDMEALLEELEVHHELSKEDHDEIKARIEFDVARCEAERDLLASPSSMAELPAAFVIDLLDLYGQRHVDVNASWENGMTPLHHAAEAGRRDLIEFIFNLEGGRHLLSKTDRQGKTPVHYASKHWALEQWLHEQQGAMQPMHSQEHRPSVNQIPPQYMKLLQQIETSGWQSVGWKNGYTMLHWAANKGDIYADLCRYLIKLEADPNAQDSQGRTALKIARDGGHNEVVAVLENLRHLPSTASRKSAVSSHSEVF